MNASLAALLATLLALPAPSWAAPSAKITYQGNLKESGVSVVGTRSMVFKLYGSSTSASALWTSPTYSVNVSTGIFRVLLEPTGVDWEAESPWVEVMVNGVALSPREELTAAPFAINALLHSGKRYTSAASAPASPGAGDFWLDTSVMPHVLKFHNGVAWTATSGGAPSVHAASHAPGGSDPIASLGALSLASGADITLSGGGTVTGLAAPSSSSDAATKGYVDSAVGSGGVLGSTNTWSGQQVFLNQVAISSKAVISGGLATGSSVTASAFFGDGSGLTNLSGTDASRVAKTGDVMTGPLTISGSTLTVTGQDASGAGLSVRYGMSAGSATLAGGLTASSATFTASGPTQYSLSLSSGVYAPAGTITAGLFVGSGAGLTNIAGTDAARVLKAGDVMTGPLTISGSTLTVSGNAFSVGGSTLVVANGSVGVGTTSPASKLHVLDGDIRVSTSAGQPSKGIVFQDGSIQTTAAGGTGGGWSDSGSVVQLVEPTDTIGSTGAGVTVSTHFIVSVGNVGIGTTNPPALLSVNGTTQLGNGAWPTASMGKAGQRVGVFSDIEQGYMFVGNMQSGVAADRGGYLYLGARQTSGTDDFAISSVFGGRETAASGDATSYLAFHTANAGGAPSEKLRITSAGNVGIGTTNPIGKLDLGTAADNQIFIGASSDPGWTVPAIQFTNSDMGALMKVSADTILSRNVYYDGGYKYLEASRASRVRLGSGDMFAVEYAGVGTPGGAITFSPGILMNSSGNVGIGTTGPKAADASARTLQLGNNFIMQNVIGAQSLMGHNAYYDGTWKRATADTAQAIRMHSGDIIFHLAATGAADSTLSTWDSSDRAMIIKNNGNVGIGTTGPNTKLEVGSGDIRISDTGNAVARRLESLHTITPNTAQSGFFSIGIRTPLSPDIGALIRFVHEGTSDGNGSGGVNSHIEFLTHETGVSNGERMRIAKNGNVGIGTTAPGQALDVAGIIRTNTGLQFPATQNPSSDVNILDDYEEGNWTPMIGGSGGQSGQTYGTQAGQYVKVGKIVTAWFEVDLAVKGTITGNVEIQGLPFTSATGPANQPVWIGPMTWSALATSWVNVVGRVNSNATTASVLGTMAAGTTNETNLVTADIINGTVFRGTFVYRSAD